MNLHWWNFSLFGKRVRKKDFFFWSKGKTWNKQESSYRYAQWIPFSRCLLLASHWTRYFSKPQKPSRLASGSHFHRWGNHAAEKLITSPRTLRVHPRADSHIWAQHCITYHLRGDFKSTLRCKIFAIGGKCGPEIPGSGCSWMRRAKSRRDCILFLCHRPHVGQAVRGDDQSLAGASLPWSYRITWRTFKNHRCPGPTN